ncbi:MAG: hypothetical protein LBL62_08540 [Planctomycetaceae bacterium]|nr:hypothetical protein [Planctomycetaceae bacterium]
MPPAKGLLTSFCVFDFFNVESSYRTPAIGKKIALFIKGDNRYCSFMARTKHLNVCCCTTVVFVPASIFDNYF